jgi:hypothetical protein
MVLYTMINKASTLGASSSVIEYSIASKAIFFSVFVRTESQHFPILFTHTKKENTNKLK